MTLEEIEKKVLQGGKLAIERMIERERKENGYIVVSQDGKVVKLWARDIKIASDQIDYSE